MSTVALDLVPARALNQVTYCPRLYYLEYVEGVMPTNEHVEDGLFQHRRVNDPDLENRTRKDGDARRTRSVSLSSDRLGVWAVRALIPLGQLTILAGTIATASGPHAGANGNQLVHRFDFEGTGTLEWVVQRHSVIAAVFGLAAIAVWFLLRRPGGDRRALRPLTVVLGLLALQGVVGGVQWALELPGELVWVHVALATATWLAMLWTVATAGRLEPRAADLATKPDHTVDESEPRTAALT